MLHIHFGTGRLGLGLVSPFLKTPDSELYLFNRALSGINPTGSSALAASRRNELLSNNSRKLYVIDIPGRQSARDAAEARERVKYDGFHAFEEESLQEALNGCLAASQRKNRGIVVTASVLSVENYGPIVDTLNVICRAKDSGASDIGDVYLIACENTVSAHEVLEHSELAQRLHAATRRHVRCVHTLVDRVCVGMQECSVEGEPTVLLEAETYGSLKLELCQKTEGLPDLLRGSRAEFSRHLHAEKDIKGWLLNGSHWIIALTAFQESHGDAELRLNEFITSTENHERYAAEVVQEMREGIEALLRSDPKYAGFVNDIDVSAYLDRAAALILERFRSNADTITRILARFRAPTPEAVTTVQSFVERFLHRIEPPLLAYQGKKGIPPKSATQGIFNLFRLQASGTYVDTRKGLQPKAA